MQTQQRVWNIFQQDGVVRFVVKICIVAAFGLCFTGAGLMGRVVGARTQSASECSTHIRAYKVVRGNGGGRTALAKQAPSGTVANADLLYTNNRANRRSCNPRQDGSEGATGVNDVARTPEPVATGSSARRQDAPSQATAGAKVALFEIAPSTIGAARNVFPYGACTWWADERYHQLHGLFVPWRNNANAWQWVARAYDFGWHVSRTPMRGWIIVLQGGVQGASAFGHVGIVEEVRSDGSAVVSSMSWGSYPRSVTTAVFHPGPGVAFVSQ